MKEEINVPGHIAIIMDGNRRWAKERKLPAIYGHNAGMKSIREIVKYCGELKIEYLSVFAFSTQNWNRSHEEVGALMGLFKKFCKNERDNLRKNNVKLRFIGDIDNLSPELRKIAYDTQKYLSGCTGLQLNICLNYSGKSEMLHAAKALAKSFANGELQANIDELSEEEFEQFLFTKEIPDVDLLIRTSGEYRISNYFLWQIAYAELVFVDKLWPDFNKNTLDDCIKEYNKRERRFGVG